jgi:hypothetical protein
MDVDEFEEYLEIQDPEVKRSIEQSRKEYLAGKGRPAEELLAEFRAEEEKEQSVEKQGEDIGSGHNAVSAPRTA